MEVLVLYGSQTGAAKSIAEQIHATALQKGYKATVASFNEHTRVGFLTAPAVVWVCSTTGNGDPPSNAEEFWRFIRRRTHPKDLLVNMRIASLGLGDQNYDKFNNAAKTIHKRLVELGARDFYGLGLADEGVGLEVVVDPWIKGLWPALAALAAEAASSSSSSNSEAAAGTALGASVAEEAKTDSLHITAPTTGAPSASSSAPLESHSPMHMLSDLAARKAAGDAYRASGHVSAPSADGGSAAAASAAGSVHSTERRRQSVSAEGAPPASTGGSGEAVSHAARGAVADALRDLSSGDDLLEAAARAASAAVGRRITASERRLPAGASAGGSSAPAPPSPAGPPAVSRLPPVDASTSEGSAAAVAAALASAAPPATDAAGATAAAAPSEQGVVIMPAALAQAVSSLARKKKEQQDSAVEGAAAGAAGSASASDGGVKATTTPSGVSDATAPARRPIRTASGIPPLSSSSSASAAGEDSVSAAVAASSALSGYPAAALRKHVAAGAGIALPPLPIAWRDLASLVGRQPAPTPGVRSLFELFPNLALANPPPQQPPVAGAPAAAPPAPAPTASAAAAAGGGAPVVLIPPAATSFAEKFYTKLPACLWQVETVRGGSGGSGEAAAAPAPAGARPPPLKITAPTLQLAGAAAAPQPAPTAALPTPGKSADCPVRLPVKAARYLTKGGRSAARRVLHMELDASRALKGDWAPGDAIGVMTPNDPSLVADLCIRLGYLPSTRVRVAPLGAAAAASSFVPKWLAAALGPEPCVFDLLTWTVDITSAPKKTLLRLLTEHATTAADKDALAFLVGRAGAPFLRVLLEEQRLNLLDLLCLFPSCAPPLGHLLSALLPLMPRFYSLACSPAADPTTLAVAFTTVEYDLTVSVSGGEAAGIHRRGVATTWLEALCNRVIAETASSSSSSSSSPPPFLHVFLRPSRDFSLPASSETPLLMIGPGTGVAPFIGFLQHRAARRDRCLRAATAVCRGYWRPGVRVTTLQDDPSFVPPVSLGPAMLFFGNQRADTDFLYKDQLEAFETEEVLTALVTAFSREGPEKVYVQHRMRERGREIAELIVKEGAHVYVCGDGAKMAKDVHDCLLELLTDWGGLEAEGAPEGAGESVSAAAAAAGEPSTASASPASLASPASGTSTASPASSAASSGGLTSSSRDTSRAAAYLKAMAAGGRYCRDIWS